MTKFTITYSKDRRKRPISIDKQDRWITATFIDKAATTESCETALKESKLPPRRRWCSILILWRCHHRWTLVIPLSRVRVSVLRVAHACLGVESKSKRGEDEKKGTNSCSWLFFEPDNGSDQSNAENYAGKVHEADLIQGRPRCRSSMDDGEEIDITLRSFDSPLEMEL